MTDKNSSKKPDTQIHSRNRGFDKIKGELTLQQKLDKIGVKLFKDWFEKQEQSGRFQGVKKNLDGINHEDTVELYLSRSLTYSILAGSLGLILSVLFIGILQLSGILPQLDTGLRYPEPIAQLLWILRPILAIVIIGGFLQLLFTGIAFVFGMYYPSYRAGIRRRRIDQTLPYSVTFMYALSRGGMSFVQVLDKISHAEGTYGEVAKEFRSVVKDTEMQSLGLPEALSRASQRTPSEKFENFCDDLRSIIKSGGDITKFLNDKSDEFLEDAEQEQEQFLDTLELIGEVYVTAFVAGPLFLIIITVILALLGGGATLQLYFIVYIILPLMNVIYFVFLDTITTDEKHLSKTLPQRHTVNIPLEQEKKRAEYLDSDLLKNWVDIDMSEKRKRIIKHPIKTISEDPNLSFVFSIPIALLIPIFALLTGRAGVFWSSFIGEPILNTWWIFTAPLLVALIPYTILYEIKARREGKIMRRFPDALKKLASANAIGMTLNEALEQVAENTSGLIGEEFQSIQRDIYMQHDVRYALISFANRAKVRIVARTVKLLTEAQESSGDVESVLEIAAKDVNTQYRLKKKQAQTMMMYTVVILISFAVYLFVIVMLDTTFLERVSGEEFEAGPDVDIDEDAPDAGGVGDVAGEGVSVDFEDVPVDTFRTVFFHSTIVQSIGSGILAGQLGSNDPKKGLKYVIMLLIVATIVFYIFTA